MSDSMINPSVSHLLEKIDNSYSLVVITSKRARQVVDGSTPMVDIDSTKAVTIAVNELYQGKLEYENGKTGIK